MSHDSISTINPLLSVTKSLYLGTEIYQYTSSPFSGILLDIKLIFVYSMSIFRMFKFPQIHQPVSAMQKRIHFINLDEWAINTLLLAPLTPFYLTYLALEANLAKAAELNYSIYCLLI